MRRDLNKILGRDESGTAEVDGIPTLVSKYVDGILNGVAIILALVINILFIWRTSGIDFKYSFMFQIKLQTDVDQLNANVTTVSQSLDEMQTKITDKIIEEKDAREEETGALKKDLDRLEKRSKELREKVKGKLGIALPDNDVEQDEEENNE